MVEDFLKEIRNAEYLKKRKTISLKNLYSREDKGRTIGKSKFKSINCPAKLNSSAIDEFLLIFLVAAKRVFNGAIVIAKKENPIIFKIFRLIYYLKFYPDLHFY